MSLQRLLAVLLPLLAFALLAGCAEDTQESDGIGDPDEGEQGLSGDVIVTDPENGSGDANETNDTGDTNETRSPGRV